MERIIRKFPKTNIKVIAEQQWKVAEPIKPIKEERCRNPGIMDDSRVHYNSLYKKVIEATKWW